VFEQNRITHILLVTQYGQFHLEFHQLAFDFWLRHGVSFDDTANPTTQSGSGANSNSSISLDTQYRNSVPLDENSITASGGTFRTRSSIWPAVSLMVSRSNQSY